MRQEGWEHVIRNINSYGKDELNYVSNHKKCEWMKIFTSLKYWDSELDHQNTAATWDESKT